jgi:hypothetical protein
MNSSQALKKNNTFEYIRSFDISRWKIKIYRLSKEEKNPVDNGHRVTLSRYMDEQSVINSLR